MRTVALVSLLALIAGCAGDGPPPDTSTSPFDVIQRTIFDTNCLSAGCHNAAAGSGNLVLESGRSYANLVKVPSFNMAAQAAGLLRVVPGNPDASYLLIKIMGPPGTGLGSQMPQAQSPLGAADIELVRSWIAAGAIGSSLPSPTSTVTTTATESPTVTQTPTMTTSPTPTPIPTVTPTGTRPATPTATASATVTMTASLTATASAVPTPTFSTESTFANIQATIFTPTCSVAFCHDATTKSGSLVLDAASSYTALVGIPPMNPAALDGGFLRVAAGHPEKSFLITKLTLPAADPLLGSPMPFVGPPLTAAQIESIRGWILRGAPND